MWIRTRLASASLSLETRVPSKDHPIPVQESISFELLPTEERDRLDLDTGEVFQDYNRATLENKQKLIEASLTIRQALDASDYQYMAMSYMAEVTSDDFHHPSSIYFSVYIDPTAFRELVANIRDGLFPSTITFEFLDDPSRFFTIRNRPKKEWPLEYGREFDGSGTIWHNTEKENSGRNDEVLALDYNRRSRSCHYDWDFACKKNSLLTERHCKWLLANRKTMAAASNLVPVGAALVSEVLSAFLLPGGAMLTLTADAYVARKRKAAAELLILEVAAGRHGQINFEEHDVEPLVDMVLRFSKAVEEGAARENLALLAQVIAGLKKHRTFEADLFRRWCRILEHLSRDELLVIGFAYRTAREFENRAEEGADNFNKLLRTRLSDAGYSEGEVEALLTAVTSTGLMSSASAWGGLAYTFTPWLKQLGELVDIEAAAELKL